MLIAERLLLIACDPMTGAALWPREQPSPEMLVSAAIACELITQGRLSLRNGLFHADSKIPTSHPLLNKTLHALGNHALDAPGVIRAVAHQNSPVVRRLLDGLFRRDILHRVSKRDWLLRSQTLYPVRSMQARNEAIEALHHAAANANDLNGLTLLFLTEAAGLLPVTMRAQEHARATRRVLDLNNMTSESSEAMRGLARIRSTLLS